MLTQYVIQKVEDEISMARIDSPYYTVHTPSLPNYVQSPPLTSTRCLKKCLGTGI